MIKKFFILFCLVLSCCASEKSKIIIDCKKLDDKTIQFTINNQSRAQIYVPNNYLTMFTSNDSIVLEAVDKDPMINYNVFVIPEMSVIPQGKLYRESLILEDLKPNVVLYFRVYTEDIIKYQNDKKLLSLYITDFVNYEKEKSFLVRGDFGSHLKR